MEVEADNTREKQEIPFLYFNFMKLKIMKNSCRTLLVHNLYLHFDDNTVNWLIIHYNVLLVKNKIFNAIQNDPIPRCQQRETTPVRRDPEVSWFILFLRVELVIFNLY